MQIDHNPNEKRVTNGIWWVLALILVLNWVGYLWFFDREWIGVFLGLGTGAILATFAIEISGNKFPGSR